MKARIPKGRSVPELGAVGWLLFDPQAGREQAGCRPAIVLSHTRYNEKTAWPFSAL
jgi:mRNA interferase MazF